MAAVDAVAMCRLDLIRNSLNRREIFQELQLDFPLASKPMILEAVFHAIPWQSGASIGRGYSIARERLETRLQIVG